MGGVWLIRPDPQVIWQTPRDNPLWGKAHARYHRSSSGGGRWERLRPMPDVWQIGYGPLQFRLKPMGFKHTGLFPEQAVNWDFMADMIRGAGRPVRVLNLFGYTGAATLACLAAGAHVTHVDASKGMVAWGRENAALSGLGGTGRCVGLPTTAANSCRGNSAGAMSTTVSSWIRPPTAAGREARCGSWRSRFTLW